jgi:fatty-acyl-CoA synthase
MDDDGKLLGPGQRGEIVVRGPLVMAGYYKNPAASAEAGRHGWHHTGDIGYLDDDQYLFIVDRAKDMIITGGFNVYSAEVEQVLLAHPAVQDCAVIGLPDEKWGERVTAVIQLRPGHSVTADEARAFVKERLGSVKAPKQVEVWPDLPRSKIGKILKPEIRPNCAPARASSRNCVGRFRGDASDSGQRASGICPRCPGAPPRAGPRSHPSRAGGCPPARAAAARAR